MGTWFFASALGNFAAGRIASLTGGDGMSEEAGKQVVLDVYETVGLYAVGIGVVVMVVSPLIKKLMHLDTLADDDAHIDGEAEAGLEAQPEGFSKG
jgi:POT family proton-dependent oligopeptide transporter